VNNVSITLVVKRCGENYLLQGYDLLQNMKYEGLVLKQQVVEIVREHNLLVEIQLASLSRGRPLSPTTSLSLSLHHQSPSHSRARTHTQSHRKPEDSALQLIQLWDYSRVTELLITKIGLTNTISATSAELGGGRRDHQCCLILLPTCKGAGIEHINSLQRGLADQQHIIDRYHKLHHRHATSLSGEPLPITTSYIKSKNEFVSKVNKRQVTLDRTVLERVKIA